VSGRTVTTPTDETWRVRRLWVPRMRGETLWSRVWRKIRPAGRRLGDVADAGDGCFIDIEEVVIILVIIVAVVLLAFVVVPLLLVLLDVLILLLLLVLGLAARVLFRRPWVVEATGAGPYRHTWRVVGWRASGEKVDDVANLLEHGYPLPPDHDTSLRPGQQAPEDAGS
jgi:hypothetical protein